MVMAKHVAVLETLADPAAAEKVSTSDKNYLTDVLRSEAVKVLPAEQNFTIMTRENINAMLPPGKSIEECEGSCLAETGRNIAADYVAQARVGLFGGSLTLSVEIYETAGNKLVASFNGDGENVKDLLAVVKLQAPDFFRKVKGSSGGWGGATGFSDINSGGSFSVQGKKSFIVEVSTEPTGAALSIDGRPVPKCMQTPCKVQVEEGEHLFVAVKDRYDDGETRTMISATNKTVNMELVPNFGTLLLEPKLAGVGRLGDISVWVDGQPVKQRKLELDPGIHEVRLKHPCHDPMEFKVGIEKMSEQRFEQPMTRGIGGLKLDAEWNGEPQALSVFVDGEEVGSTPFLGEVPLCSRVTVGEDGKYEDVHVNLKWHETVEYTHKLKRKPASVIAAEESSLERNRQRASAAYDELDGKEPAKPQVGESIPTNVEPESTGIKWVPVGISAAVAVTGTILAVVGNSKAKSIHDEKPADAEEYKKNKDDIHGAQTLRTAGIVTAIVGAIGVGVSFAF
ncbi:PEGA domain-containing protein [Fibrobacter sp. UWR4]|nr:PEGA domain-containing protein [Fibrobacter sp. UWR4]PZW72919.1 PEGA domain-containing protein [Fibrobacter sp. UWR1]